MANESLPLTNSKSKICAVEGCSRPKACKGFCWNHHYRFKKYGDPLGVRKSRLEQLLAKVNKTDSCWEWTGSVARNGYGKTHYAGKHVTVHRLSFFLHNGHWPEPMCLHSCDNRRCVNPAHLRAGTSRENGRDAVERKRTRIGTRNVNARLTPAAVAEIRTNPNTKEMARKYGVAYSTIQQARTGRTWKHV